MGGRDQTFLCGGSTPQRNWEGNHASLSHAVAHMPICEVRLPYRKHRAGMLCAHCKTWVSNEVDRMEKEDKAASDACKMLQEALVFDKSKQEEVDEAKKLSALRSTKPSGEELEEYKRLAAIRKANRSAALMAAIRPPQPKRQVRTFLCGKSTRARNWGGNHASLSHAVPHMPVCEVQLPDYKYRVGMICAHCTTWVSSEVERMEAEVNTTSPILATLKEALCFNKEKETAVEEFKRVARARAVNPSTAPMAVRLARLPPMITTDGKRGNLLRYVVAASIMVEYPPSPPPPGLCYIHSECL